MSNQKDIQYITVGALSKYINQKFERDPHLQKVRVLGEVSNFRHRPNSHQYFSLKEGQVQINAIMFRSQFERLKFQLEEGMKVYVTARVGVYQNGGRYQLYVESIEPDGVGALYLALEQLKEKMRAQGLFDLPKKQIKAFPKRIAVITSPSGAVIRDIITTIHRRYPIVQVVVFPSRVQGKEAVADLVTAFDQVKASVLQFDGVILARGGGSIEDLWCFNDEAVARAILACDLPVISSIGHETDTTIADMVADLRAPTPTAAAELSVPVLKELLFQIDQARHRLLHSFNRRLQVLRQRLNRSSQSYVLQQPDRLYQTYLQSLQNLDDRLLHRYQQMMSQLTQSLQGLQQSVYHYNPQQTIRQQQEKSSYQSQNLSKAIKQELNLKKEHLHKQMALLDAFSPLKILNRGYSIVQKNGQIIKTSQELSSGDPVQIYFSQGQARLKVESLDHDASIQTDN